MNWNEMTPEERLAHARAQVANQPPVDWAAVRRATAAKGNRTEEDWELVDAFAS